MNTSPNAPASLDSSTRAGWRMARRLLLTAAALATLIAAFYTVENWRGKRAWDASRRALEAMGEVLDWAAYIPAPVPDDQNFYKAPSMREWFVKPSFRIGGPEPANGPRRVTPPPRKDTDLVLAEVQVVASNAAPAPEGATVLRLDDPGSREEAAKLLRQLLGPCSMGSRNDILVARPLQQIKPLRLVLQADPAPGVKELTAFFPFNPVANSLHASPAVNYLRIDPAGNNTFRVCLKKPVYGAADYLAWTEPATADFDLIRSALQRPYARIDCDYQQPYAIAIPNFVMLRTVAQTLSERAQAYLLLGQPDAAWHELSLVHDLCQILEAKPSGRPLTLVAAMIHVAIIGLYTGIVEDGLRLHAWQEPQLLGLERQLRDTDLLAPVVEALREERAATSRTFEITSRRALLKLFDFKGPVSQLALLLMPRGWFYQNMAVGAQLEQAALGSVDLKDRLVRPRDVSDMLTRFSAESERRSPYRFLVALAIPNFAKALQTAAFNQTLADQARVACALERFRLAEGHYPESLDALTPRFAEKLPHDLVGGQPLSYRRAESGAYLLYSVGWNEKDDGGVAGKTREEGDWGWGL